MLYKQSNQKINNLQDIPTINCISLEESNNRRDELIKQFKVYNICNINFLLTKRFEYTQDKIIGKLSDTLLNGTKGAVVAHLKNIKQWLNNSLESEEYGFFCEDDLSLECVPYWDKTWKRYINCLPNDWDCVQLLVINETINTLDISNRNWNDWGATVFILKREFAKKIINCYCINDTFKLELPEPNSNIQPLTENLIYTLGKTYTLPLFTENVNFKTTILPNNQDIKETSQHKLNHIKATNKVLKLWKNKKLKIVDCFPFFNEKELLELRINLLQNFVDEFIIIDSNYTHSGQPKPYTCKQVIQDLGLNSLKIKVIEVDLSEEKCGPPTLYDLYYDENAKHGSRERIQRDYICNVLEDYSDNTVFIVSDCDEIVDPKNINFICNIVKNNQHVICKIPLVYLQGQGNFRVYKKNNNEPYPWDCSMFFATKQQLKTHSATHIRANFQLSLPIAYITQGNKKLEDLGWHFSWMGNLERIKTKATSYCHHGAVLDDYIYHELYGDKMLSYFDNYKLYEGNYPVSGLKDAFIQKYPINNLPKKIFSLPNVYNFLLPNNNSLPFNKILKNYSLDIENPFKNFEVGYCYYNQGHTAPALSFFLRCAERTEDKLLAYEALIYGYLCYKEQKIRDETAKSLIMHALCLLPERPEARWLMSVFYEHKQLWMYSYYHAELGLIGADLNLKPLKYYKDFPGKIGLLFQKAVAGYWWGKNEESTNIFLDLRDNYQLTETYKEGVQNNLKRLDIENT